MIEPSFATLVMLGIGILLLFIIPLLDGSKRLGKYISLRYTLIVITTVMALGCILDFSHLNESSRNIALTGGLALIGLFVIMRSLEKCKLGAKTLEIEVHKGDTGASAKLHGDKTTDVKETDNG